MSDTAIKSEALTKLIAAAQDDQSLREKILHILRQDEATRHAMLDKFIQHCENKGAPAEFIDAIRCLKIPDIAVRAIQILTN